MKIVENVSVRRYDVWVLPRRAYIPLLAVRGILFFALIFAALFFVALAPIGVWGDSAEVLAENGDAFLATFGGALPVIVMGSVSLLVALPLLAWTIRRDKIVHQAAKGRVENELPHSKLWAMWLLFEDEGYFLRWYPSIPNVYRFVKYHSARKRFKVLAVAGFTAFFGGLVALAALLPTVIFTAETATEVSNTTSVVVMVIGGILFVGMALLGLASVVHMAWIRYIAPATEPGDVRQTANEEGY